MDWAFGDMPLLAAKELRELETWAKQSGVEPDIVIATGATRADQDLADWE
jgi:hypothetical protein